MFTVAIIVVPWAAVYCVGVHFPLDGFCGYYSAAYLIIPALTGMPAGDDTWMSRGRKVSRKLRGHLDPHHHRSVEGSRS